VKDDVKNGTRKTRVVKKIKREIVQDAATGTVRIITTPIEVEVPEDATDKDERQ
jgi:hypothetical protein